MNLLVGAPFIEQDSCTHTPPPHSSYPFYIRPGPCFLSFPCRHGYQHIRLNISRQFAFLKDSMHSGFQLRLILHPSFHPSIHPSLLSLVPLPCSICPTLHRTYRMSLYTAHIYPSENSVALSPKGPLWAPVYYRPGEQVVWA